MGNWVSMLDEARDRVVEKHGAEGAEAVLEMELAAVRESLSNLRSFPFVKAKEDAGEITLHGAHFAIADGILRQLSQDSGEFSSAG